MPPNGDGINETLTVSYKLRKVTDERPVLLRIFDLAGTQVTTLKPLLSRSGEFSRAWDGRDSSGQLSPPGTYIYELSSGSLTGQTQLGLFSLAY